MSVLCPFPLSFALPTVGFDQVASYEIPYLHPLAVHFPLVLLLLAAGAASAYALIGSQTWRRTLVLLLLLGTASAFWAHATGETLLSDVEGEPSVERFIAYHKTTARLTKWVSLAAFLAAGGTSVWWERRQRRRATSAPAGLREKEPLSLRLGLLLATLVVAALVAYTAHLGGLMVWGVPR